MSTTVEETKHLNHILTQIAMKLKIINFEFNLDTNINYGDGFVSQFYTGHIRDKDTGNITSVAIKRPPFWEFEYRPLFNNENLFYNTVMPALDDLQIENLPLKSFDNVPMYFCGSMEPKNEYIAMENLKQLGYIMFEKKRYLDKAHLALIFKTYGKFHALSFVLRDKNPEKYQDKMKDITDLGTSFIEFEGKSLIASFSAAVDALDPEKDKRVYNEVQDLKDNLIKAYFKVSSYKGEYKCLIHGDGWSNNMLFRYSESGQLLDIKLIDFQFCRHDTPIFDLSYFFYSAASKEDLDCLENYLEIYHKSFSDFATELGNNPDKLFPLEALIKEWKEYALIGVIYGIYLWQIKLLPKEDFQVLAQKNVEQDMEENSELWTSLLDKSCETDSFKEKTTAILRHAVEYGIIRRKPK